MTLQSTWDNLQILAKRLEGEDAWCTEHGWVGYDRSRSWDYYGGIHPNHDGESGYGCKGDMHLDAAEEWICALVLGPRDTYRQLPPPEALK